ncbi:unnamed protein product [Discula destructiva]
MTMGDIAEGWQTVLPTSHYAGANGRLSRAQVEEYERQTLKEWRNCKEDWSGLGKHISVNEHPETKTRVHTRFKLIDDLGSTQISDVKKVHYAYHGKKPPICLARKRIKPRRNRTVEILRAEAEVMERLDHDHIIKLVGTYSIRFNELYLLVWPVAVCDLSSFLDDVDTLRNGPGDRQDVRDDIYRRFEALDLQTPNSPRGSLEAQDHIVLLRQIMGCIAQATAYCHRRNIRHLDLKPSNILLGPGRVYLADFGIAKDVEDRDSTRTMGRVGTPKWQASEVVLEKDEWSMKAADVYALGLVLLNIAAVLYNGNLSDLDHILTDMDPDSRADGLERYQATLAQLALASQEVRHPGDHTVAPRHILELTSRMTSPNPKDRPSAASVDKELVELGGLDQVYHSPCCKKSTRYLTELVDTREKVTMSRSQALQEENLRHARRIKELEAKDETYHLRLQNAEKRHAKDVANLEKLLEGERQQRKRLETQLADLQRYGGRKAAVAKGNIPSTAGLQMKSYGMPPLSTRKAPFESASKAPEASPTKLPSPPAHPAPTAEQQTKNPHTRPGTSFAGATAAAAAADAAVTTAREETDSTPKLGLMSRRTNSNSKLPLAVNPATPIRSRAHTPNTPNLHRDLSLTDSTQGSMTSSRLSIATQETSAAPSPAVGSKSPLLLRDLAAAAANTSRAGTVPATGLGIQGHIFEHSVAHHHSDETGDVRHAFATGRLSPVMSTSAMSSPRTAKTELDSEHSPRLTWRVPGLPTAPSWAEIARKDQSLRTS